MRTGEHSRKLRGQHQPHIPDEVHHAHNRLTSPRTLSFDRQARYISALEQLADPAPVTRLSGAQSLVWLIDEWLADETLPGPTRHTEATALIDSLCAYIRSPYPMAPEYELLSRDEPDPALSEEDKRNFPARQSRIRR